MTIHSSFPWARRSAVRLTLCAALASGAFGAADAGAAGFGQSSGGPLVVYGLTQDAAGAQALVRFREHRPGLARTVGPITGLTGDTRLVGIDFRPATGALYGLGEAGGIYTIDLRTAAATFVAPLGVPLSGQSFGVDFNPTVDRLRVVSNDGQNLRVNVADGATTVDTALSLTGVVAAAYTNNDADPNTATTLFDLDATLDQVAIQAPPNNGNLNPTGKLLVDAGADAGFDIFSRLRRGVTVEVKALASLVVDGRAGLYSVNLITGKATFRGFFRASQPVVDIAIPLED
jgi:hypothetical protein